ncbi:MAG: hypothetical protein KKG25_06845 [Bacteroidetes bacterium]|nr:hypothetical protein [Bacteroidota bacterium]MBU1484559.1 hypothetical protein [Bacteroidota bacterium]MBU1759220.1 hypothetical protein [Bacteroidota bacterium]MBU2267704.1 hypothetical protein [Bacteroidota bacterium]MBU2374414.1 hypothetical protein [Bacteroidota bacterium]
MYKLNSKTIFIIGLVLIAIIYSVYNMYLIDSDFYWTISRRIRNFNKILLILLIYGIGTLSLKNYLFDWLIFIWHMIHIVCLSILILIGGYDWLFGVVGEQLKNITNTLMELLISPLFLICFYIINNRLRE